MKARKDVRSAWIPEGNPPPAAHPTPAELAAFDESKQAALKQAIADSLNVGDSYSADDVALHVISTTQRQPAPAGNPQVSGRGRGCVVCAPVWRHLPRAGTLCRYPPSC